MTAAATTTREEPKFCAQTFAAGASLAILVHFTHELIAMWGEVPVVQPVIGVVIVAATVGLTGAWYRLGKPARRTVAAAIGTFWALAAAEHLGNLGAGSALDYTGVLTFAGGLVLVFAAYWDYHRPLDVSL